MQCKSLRWICSSLQNAYRIFDRRFIIIVLGDDRMDPQKQQSISALFETVTSLERKLMNEWNQHNELGFSKSHILLLRFLANEGPKRPSAIAEHLKVTTGGVTVLTTKLIKAGLVERKQNEVDRRAALIHITDTGYEMLDTAQSHVDTLFDKLFGMLTTEEIDTLRTIFNKCLLDKRN